MKNLFKHIVLSGCIAAILFFSLQRFFSVEITRMVSIFIGVLLSLVLLKKDNIQSSFNHFILVIGFVTILFIPFFGKKQSKSMENRELEAFPEWRWSNVWQFFKDYQNYFNDRFTLKNELVETHGKVKYDYLKLNNLTTQVIYGKDGWLFYNDAPSLKNISEPFTPAELQRLNYNLTLITKWFEERGVKYYLTFPPVKPRIYDDRIPGFLKQKLEYSSLDQLYDYLEKNSKYNFIYFYNELKQEKQKNDVYLRYDTHWNERGAFIGYQSIIKAMSKDFPQLIPYQLSDFNESYESLITGDLLNLLGYQTKDSYKESVFEVKGGNSPELTYSTRLPDNPENVFQIFEMENDTSGLDIYVVRDSYSENLKKFLSLNFKKSVYDWTPVIAVTRIGEYKPDIVLHEKLERFNVDYFDLPPEIENDTAFTNRFNIEDF